MVLALRTHWLLDMSLVADPAMAQISDPGTTSPVGWHRLSKFSGGMPAEIVSMMAGPEPEWYTAEAIKESRAFDRGDLVAWRG